MDETEVRHVLGVLGSHVSSMSTHGWLRCTCPLAKYKHAKGTDNVPSFAVSIEPESISYFRCQSCGSKGTMIDLIWQLERLSKKTMPDVAAFVMKTNNIRVAKLSEKLASVSYGVPPPRTVAGIRVSAAKAPKLEVTVLPETDLDAFETPTGEVLEYLKGPRRGLTDETIFEWELCWQPHARRVGIPVRDLDGKLVGISGRAFDPMQKPKYLHSTGFQRQLYLFGEYFINKDYRTAYIVEGHFDAIKLWQYGYDNVLAIMGSSLNLLQLEKLKKYFENIVLVPDGDEPGYEAVSKMKVQLHPHFKIKLIPVPYGKDPDELTKDEAKELIGPPQRA